MAPQWRFLEILLIPSLKLKSLLLSACSKHHPFSYACCLRFFSFLEPRSSPQQTAPRESFPGRCSNPDLPLPESITTQTQYLSGMMVDGHSWMLRESRQKERAPHLYLGVTCHLEFLGLETPTLPKMSRKANRISTKRDGCARMIQMFSDIRSLNQGEQSSPFGPWRHCWNV